MLTAREKNDTKLCFIFTYWSVKDASTLPVKTQDITNKNPNMPKNDI